jgi:hypothetical protein
MRVYLAPQLLMRVYLAPQLLMRVYLAPQLLLIQITPLLKKILNHQVMMGDLLKGEGLNSAK